ncbi:hypothetical protein HK097_002332 [Rhizophlyctis rosea]|uniref:CCAAT-binding factor domain-containing protein n=1 Tax=Rhizophlyctis rosea TaxID=64517 RepID=A0AAD5SRE4_9FUNG|nr:hypothetical protein HK097_002332 [Rhizophlyctis rosea]
MAAPKVTKTGASATTPKKRKASAESAETNAITPDRVRQLAKECLESATKLNNLVELLDNANGEVSHTALVALQHVFSKLLERGDLKRPKKSNTKSAKDPKTKVTEWLRDLRGQFVAELLMHLSAGAADKQTTALQILLGMVKHESEHHDDFQNDLFERVVEACVSNDNLSENVLELLIRDINAFDDVRYYFYKDFGKYLNAIVPAEVGAEERRSKRRKMTVDPTKLPAVVNQGLSILTKLNPPPEKDEELGHCMANVSGETSKGQKKAQPALQAHQHRQAFTECWLAFMRQPLNDEVYKQILLMIHKRIIPYMTQATLLIDFLTDSYDAGGPLSLLALNGLFTLITQHNLDYPDFYKKLYALFDRNLMHVKYRSRFFRLVDLFLASSQLPAYLIAAFLKRMSRLCLNAPPAGILAVIPQIYNLLKKHPACLPMIHKEGDLPTLPAQDPFDYDEADPMKCKAIDSSLWELQVLKSHYLPSISGLAKIFEEDLSKPVYDLEDFLDHSYQSLYETETKKKEDEEGTAAALAVHVTVTGMFQRTAKSSFWELV